MVCSWEVDHLLDLITGPVRVLSKNNTLPQCRWRQGHKGVTGGRKHHSGWKQRKRCQSDYRGNAYLASQKLRVTHRLRTCGVTCYFHFM
uniref:Uncharacterized protein n=1 Tax=Anguilla anguilla TaxID=7936 RepID=A0A0E9SUW2_ANGAN